MTDGELVRAVQQGDRASLEVLYQRHLPGVWRYLDSHLPRGRQATEDLVSETFLAAIRAVASFDPAQGSVGGWLLGIARNKLRDHLRRAGREGDGGQARDEAVEATTAEADQGLLADEVRRSVLQTLDALDEEHRLVLEWKYVDSLSVREIAERLGRSERAVEAMLYRARDSFRAAFARGAGSRSVGGQGHVAPS